MRLLLTLFLFTGVGHLCAQQSDSAIHTMDLTTASRLKLTRRTLIVPVSLITYGAFSQSNNELREFDVRIKNVVRKDADFHSPVDNYLQYIPGLSVYALNAVGIKGKHNFRDRTMIYLLSNAMMGITVQAIKKITGVQRPDGFGKNAFPSGHTATVFAGAEFLYQEYNDRSAGYGIAGYITATSTGIVRMYNNRHWLRDVVAGAGFGILATKIVYWFESLIAKKLFHKKVTNHFILANFRSYLPQSATLIFLIFAQMEEVLQQIENYKKRISQFTATDAKAIEEFRIKWLGTKGIVKSVMGEMKNVPAEKKKEFGQILNDFKTFAEEKFESLKSSTSDSSQRTSDIDLTLPGDPMPLGSRHPITLMRNRIVSIFQRLGFAVAEGPEIEDDWHNFTALNLHEHHPARDMQDTFYVQRNPDWLLRTHTSNVQIREMEKGKLPIRGIYPGRVYRNETISARSHCFFHQIEGLYIDENVSFADLKQTLYFFVKEMYGKDVRVRFRPSYFPFTEPSAEMDVSCFICGGVGCNICKHTGWVEILGCGMVHPNVLQNCNIDPAKYTGFAFGMGVERPAMLKYGINDIRLFSENDVRFLKHFTSAI